MRNGTAITPLSPRNGRTSATSACNSTPGVCRARSIKSVGGCRPTITSLAVGSCWRSSGENFVEQQSDRVEVRPPIESAEKQDPGRIAHALHRFKETAVDAVIDDIDVGLPELFTDEPGVLLADGDDTIGLAKRLLLEAAKLFPLRFEERFFQDIRFVLAVALPDQRIDVMGDDDARSRDRRIDGFGR